MTRGDDTGRRPRVPRVQTSEDRDLAALERLQGARGELEAEGREQFGQLLTGDNTVPDPEAPRTVREDTTGVHELERRVQAALEDFDPRDARLARVVTRIVGQHIADDRIRRANRTLIAAAGVGDDELAARLKKLEDWKQTMVGTDERNGRIGRLTEMVRSTRWWYRAAVGLLLAVATGLGTVVTCAAKRIDERAHDEGRVEEWRRQTEMRLDAITGALWGAGMFTPVPPAPPGDVP